MPTGKVAAKFIERLIKLETKMEGLIWYQRWQMGLLAAILAAVAGAWVSR